MKTLKKRKQSIQKRKGMTYVELLVALTLLVIIVLAFTPALVYSYNNLYKAGLMNEKTYQSKADIETKLSIREDDPFLSGGLQFSFKQYTDSLMLKMRDALGKVKGLESLYGVGKAKVRILSNTTMPDDQPYFPITMQLYNVNFTSVTAGSGANWPDDKTQVMISINPSTRSDYTAATFLTHFSVSGDANTQIVTAYVTGVDITYSPLKITVYYYDEFDNKKTTTAYAYITTADMMFVGKVTNADNVQYFTSPGVQNNTAADGTVTSSFYLAGRKMYDAPISTGTTINRVRYISSTQDGVTGGNYYAMCGMNSNGTAFIRRLWLGSVDSYNTYDVFSGKNDIDSTSGTTYYRNTWAGDYSDGYTLQQTGGTAQNAASAGTFSTNFKASTSYVGNYGSSPSSMAVSNYSATSENAAVAGKGTDGAYYPKSSIGLYLSSATGNNGMANPTGGSTTMPCNWASGDGISRYNDDGKNHYDEDVYVNGIIDTSVNSSGDLVPLVFFSTDGTPATINRVYEAATVPVPNDRGLTASQYSVSAWGTTVETMYQERRYRKYYKNNNEDDIHWSIYSTKTNRSCAWVTGSGGTSLGCPPNNDVSDDVINYHQHYYLLNNTSNPHVYVQESGNDAITGEACRNWGYPGWWQSWTSDGHTCAICDVGVRMTGTPIGTAAFDNTKTTAAQQEAVRNVLIYYISHHYDQNTKSYVQNTGTALPATTSSFAGTGGGDQGNANVCMKAYTNIGTSFVSNSTDSAMYSALFNSSSASSAATNNADLTDVYFMGYSKNLVNGAANYACTYTGVTPAAALLCSPGLTGAHNTASSGALNCFVVRSNGLGGYSIYEYDQTATDFSNFTSKSALPSNVSPGDSATDRTDASFTMGYSSNHALVFNSLTGNLTANNTNSDDSSLILPTSFDNITTYAGYHGVVIGAGYKVGGNVSTALYKSERCTDPVHGSMSGDAIVDLTLPTAAVFSSSNFTPIYGNPHFSTYFSVNDGTGNKILINGNSNFASSALTNSSSGNAPYAAQSLGFYFETGTRNGTTIDRFITSYPTCAESYTTLKKSSAIANRPLLVLKNTNDTTFTQLYLDNTLDCKIMGVTLYRESDNLLSVVIGTSNGLIACGHLTYSETEDSYGAECGTADVKSFYWSSVPDLSYYYSNIRAVGSDVNGQYVFASGDQQLAGTYISVSTDGGNSWIPIQIPGLAKVYNIYGFCVKGDYVYAVGTDKASGSEGVVCYCKLSESLNAASWQVKTTYATSYSYEPTTGTISAATDTATLPPLYSCDGIN